MTHRIAISETAEAEAEAAYLWMLRRDPEHAARWYAGLLDAVESLALFPGRCAVAPENDRFDGEIRHLLYGRGRNVYRILFTILEPTPDEAEPAVRILHVRHAAQRSIGESDAD